MTRIARLFVAACALLWATARADVKVEEKSSAKLEGVFGKLLNRSTAKGQVRTVAVQGDRRMTLDEGSGEIVDLQEEKIYRFDPKARKYEVITFAELRKQAEEAAKEVPEEESEPAPRDDRETEYQVELDVKQTGQEKDVNGFSARQVVSTVTIHKRGMTLEKGGGTVITSDTWVTQDVKAQDEIAKFEQRYLERLYGKAATAAFSDIALAALSGPGMGEAMEKLRTEGAKVEGYPILVTTTFERVKPPQGGAAEETPTSASGLGGFFAKKLAQKVSNRGGPRSTFLTTINEVLSISTSVASSDVELPSGYTEKKRK